MIKLTDCPGITFCAADATVTTSFGTSCTGPATGVAVAVGVDSSDTCTVAVDTVLDMLPSLIAVKVNCFGPGGAPAGTVVVYLVTPVESVSDVLNSLFIT